MLDPTFPPSRSTGASSPTRAAPVRTMAVALWVVVGTLLAYGIAETVLKASALFA